MPDQDNEQAGFDNDQQGGETVRAPERTPEPEVEYANLTKAQYDDLMSRAARIDEIAATQDKSFGTFGRTIKGIQDAVDALKSGEQVEIPQEDIDALKEDGFAPLAKALEKIRSLRSSPAQAFDPATIDELVQQRIAPALETINTRVEQAVETRLLAKQFPDWKAITSTPEFASYVGTLPIAERKTLDDSWDSDFIGKHIAAFTAKSSNTTQRTNRFAAAATPSGNGRTNTSTTGTDERAGFDSVK